MSSMAGPMTCQPRMVFVPLFTPKPARKAKAPRPMEAGLDGARQAPGGRRQAVSVWALALRRASTPTAARPSRAITLASASGTGFTQAIMRGTR